MFDLLQKHESYLMHEQNKKERTMITKEMKKEIVERTMYFSKGLIESMGHVQDAYIKTTVSRDELETFIDDCAAKLLAMIEAES